MNVDKVEEIILQALKTAEKETAHNLSFFVNFAFYVEFLNKLGVPKNKFFIKRPYFLDVHGVYHVDDRVTNKLQTQLNDPASQFCRDKIEMKLVHTVLKPDMQLCQECYSQNDDYFWDHPYWPEVFHGVDKIFNIFTSYHKMFERLVHNIPSNFLPCFETFPNLVLQESFVYWEDHTENVDDLQKVLTPPVYEAVEKTLNNLFTKYHTDRDALQQKLQNPGFMAQCYEQVGELVKDVPVRTLQGPQLCALMFNDMKDFFLKVLVENYSVRSTDTEPSFNPVEDTLVFLLLPEQVTKLLYQYAQKFGQQTPNMEAEWFIESQWALTNPVSAPDRETAEIAASLYEPLSNWFQQHPKTTVTPFNTLQSVYDTARLTINP